MPTWTADSPPSSFALHNARVALYQDLPSLAGLRDGTGGGVGFDMAWLPNELLGPPTIGKPSSRNGEGLATAATIPDVWRFCGRLAGFGPNLGDLEDLSDGTSGCKRPRLPGWL